MNSIPIHPPGSSVEMNIRLAKSHTGVVRGPADIFWFYNMVRNGGEWDYKQRGRQYQDFGNFNYGAVGYAIGMPGNVLLRVAGWAQSRAGTSMGSWNNWCGQPPYGDDPMDQEMIQAGMEYAKFLGY
jgi:hypothetical protein